VEKFHGALSNTLKVSVTNDTHWVTMIPYVECAIRSSPIRGLGLSPYKIRQSGYSMGMPINLMMLKNFDEEYNSPPEYIVNMKNNIDRLNYIVRKNKLENQAVMKETYDNKVTLYKFYQGQRCYLHDPVARVGDCYKLKRRWRGPFLINKNSFHNVFLYDPSTDKYLEKLVNINRIKTCYQRDNMPEDDEDIEDMPIVEMTYSQTYPRTPQPLTIPEVETQAEEDTHPVPT